MASVPDTVKEPTYKNTFTLDLENALKRLGFSGIFWEFLGFFGIFGNFGIFLVNLGFFGIFWDFLGFFGINPKNPECESLDFKYISH